MQIFEPAEISSQVDKIVTSSEFSGGKRLTQLLRYVTEQKIHCREGHLKQYTIAVEALGYPDEFDPQSNPSVRILAKRLRRALDLYYATEGNLDPIRINIPKGTYVPSFSRNADATPANVRNTVSDGRASESDTLSANLYSPSIGVVLFRSLNDSKDLDYIGSGITEELIISLTRFTNFRVIGPLFREVFRKKDLDIYGIGTTYNVRFMLEGTIRKREESLHITAKLIDTVSGGNIWGETIKCDVLNGSLAACEEQIVNSVAATIGDNFGVMNTVLSKDALNGKSLSSNSYEAILRFYHYIMVLTEQSYVDALNALESAARHEHNDAFCLAALGDLLITSYFTGYDEAGSVVDRVEELGRQSVALDPNCQQARFTMAMVYFARLEKRQFISEVSHVLRINPNNANLVAALGMHLWMTGEHDQGKNLMEKAMALNPHHPGWCYMVSYCHHYRNGDFSNALADAQKINSPELYIDPLFRAAAYGQLDNGDAGKSAVTELISLSPDFKRCGREIMKRLFFLDEHVDMLWDGLEKAGI
jgi:adenylate cyclase